jgi:hypothetical protein
MKDSTSTALEVPTSTEGSRYSCTAVYYTKFSTKFSTN